MWSYRLQTVNTPASLLINTNEHPPTYTSPGTLPFYVRRNKEINPPQRAEAGKGAHCTFLSEQWNLGCPLAHQHTPPEAQILPTTLPSQNYLQSIDPSALCYVQFPIHCAVYGHWCLDCHGAIMRAKQVCIDHVASTSLRSSRKPVLFWPLKGWTFCLTLEEHHLHCSLISFLRVFDSSSYQRPCSWVRAHIASENPASKIVELFCSFASWRHWSGKWERGDSVVQMASASVGDLTWLLLGSVYSCFSADRSRRKHIGAPNQKQHTNSAWGAPLAKYPKAPQLSQSPFCIRKSCQASC